MARGGPLLTHERNAERDERTIAKHLWRPSRDRCDDKTRLPSLLCISSISLILDKGICLSVHARRSRLKVWQSDKTLGEIEELHVQASGCIEVNVQWTSTESRAVNPEDRELVTIQLPNDESKQVGGVSESLWPSALAGAILLCAPTFRKALRGKDVLELGSGLGLAGLCAAASQARSVILSDKEEETILWLRETIELNNDDHQICAMEAKRVEWRDRVVDPRQVDCIIGTDVAYYHYLIQPLVDTAKASMKSGGLTWIVGPATRQSQWDLFDKLKDGGYNQLSDCHEDPWRGVTHMLLYELHLGAWREVLDDDPPENELQRGQDAEEENMIPIAVLLHCTDADQFKTILTEYDHVATREDRDKQAISF